MQIEELILQFLAKLDQLNFVGKNVKTETKHKSFESFFAKIDNSYDHTHLN